jgi:DNA-directed RNA polymerase subunit RPC12/RpoP
MEVHDSKLVYVTYICGKGNCGKESKLKANDAVKCTVCGYRILYKKRIIDPKEPIQYEAI